MSIPFTQPTTHLDSFAPRILSWFDHNGRHHLPWQQHRLQTADPYAVWLSEVMLQQTQVTTVIPYFERFITSFPTVFDLATADWETVAEHWAGLGYYARARNLHKGAKQLVAVIQATGDFPQTVPDWEKIAGVGLSTAGAIVAMGIRGYGVICDGNVKRVLTRWAGIADDITKIATTKQLWALAERLTPIEQSGHYAQAMMDMGATLCTKAKPACLLCPLQSDCIAHAQGQETAYPVKSKKAPNPAKFSLALILQNEQGKTLWLQRPDQGIWGGLYVLPLLFWQKTKTEAINSDVIAHYQQTATFEAEYTTAEQIIFDFLQQHDLMNTQALGELFDSKQAHKHGLTHFHWFLMPIQITLNSSQAEQLSQLLVSADQTITWADDSQVTNLALPTAMQALRQRVIKAL